LQSTTEQGSVRPTINSPIEALNFYEILEKYISNITRRYSKNTAKKYTTQEYQLKAFNDTLEFRGINHFFYKEWIDSLFEQNYLNNTIARYTK